MFAYRAPGVYFEWLDSRAPAIDVLRTDIAGFAGIASRGPLHRPVKKAILAADLLLGHDEYGTEWIKDHRAELEAAVV